jgi:hypothetical protein
MTKQIKSAVVAISLVATISVVGMASVFGKLTANIPFDFMVNGKQLPAGKYDVKSGSIGGTIVLFNAEQSKSVIAQAATTSHRGSDEARLVFRRYGSQYFLAKVVSPTQSIELGRTKAEREAAKSAGSKLALSDVQPEIVTVSVNAGQ